MSLVVLDTDVASSLLRRRTPPALVRQFADFAEHEGLTLLRE